MVDFRLLTYPLSGYCFSAYSVWDPSLNRKPYFLFMQYVSLGFLYCAFGISVFKQSFQCLIHKDILLYFSSVTFVFMPSD